MLRLEITYSLGVPSVNSLETSHPSPRLQTCSVPYLECPYHLARHWWQRLSFDTSPVSCSSCNLQPRNNRFHSSTSSVPQRIFKDIARMLRNTILARRGRTSFRRHANLAQVFLVVCWRFWNPTCKPNAVFNLFWA